MSITASCLAAVRAVLQGPARAPVFVPRTNAHHEIVIDDTPEGFFNWTARVYANEGATVEKTGVAATHDDAVRQGSAWAAKEMGGAT